MTPTLVLQKLFEVRDEIHYQHLTTTSYAAHKALNAFYDEWLDLSDSFLETYQGRYRRISGRITMIADGKTDTVAYLKKLYDCIESDFKSIVSESDDDLLNIIADMKQLVNKTIYLLTLV